MKCMACMSNDEYMLSIMNINKHMWKYTSHWPMPSCDSVYDIYQCLKSQNTNLINCAKIQNDTASNVIRNSKYIININILPTYNLSQLGCKILISGFIVVELLIRDHSIKTYY